MSDIKIMRTIHVESPGPGERADVNGIGYVSNERNVLEESISIGNQHLIRRSEDHGKTWEKTEEWKKTVDLEDGLKLERMLPSVYYCDSDNGLAVRVFGTGKDDPAILAWEYAESPWARTTMIYVQISRDEGKTWSEPEQLIVQGGEFDEVHWMPGVFYGRNGVMCASTPIAKASDGSLILPFCGGHLFENGNIIDPDADPETANPDGAVLWKSGCLFGTWRADGSGLDWSAGECVTLPRKYSCDGGDEPAVAYLPDGRMFVGLRARTYPHTGQEAPSQHYYAISENDGKTWSEPEPLLFDDGSYAYSPACFIGAFRSSKNGRLYVMTNLADGPCVNCDPRNKLYIAEIDTDTFRIKKDTVAFIMRNSKKAGEPDTIRYSNFRWYEDRETQNIVLFVTPCGGEGEGMNSHSYRCDIELPV